MAYSTLLGNRKLRTIVDDTTDTTGRYIYIGKSEIGIATSVAAWLVQRIDTDNGADIQWADAGEPDQIWDNRVSLTYT